jgi:hypothetical protein
MYSLGFWNLKDFQVGNMYSYCVFTWQATFDALSGKLKTSNVNKKLINDNDEQLLNFFASTN